MVCTAADHQQVHDDEEDGATRCDKDPHRVATSDPDVADAAQAKPLNVKGKPSVSRCP